MISQEQYSSYQDKIFRDIKEMLSCSHARPVLFLGSGITKRYASGPSWVELLEKIATQVGMSKDEFNFIAQKSENDLAILGTELTEHVHKWAWGSGRKEFPADFYEPLQDKSIFIKYLASAVLKNIGKMPNSGNLSQEVSLLKKSSPHAVITTNFDNLASELFPDYELIIGEKIIPMSMNITGEIYQIHGNISDPSSLVLNKKDYEKFTSKRKYISSKLMTYFAEYPVFILGYGLGDSNVNQIISDLGEAIREDGGILKNVYYVEWVPDISSLSSLKEEHIVLVKTSPEVTVSVKTIVTNEFLWILKAISDFSTPISVNTKTLRNLASRVVDLVRSDAPKTEIEIDYAKIEKLTGSNSELAMVLGITKTNNPNLDYPYTLKQAATALGYKTWQKIQPHVLLLNQKLGYDVKSKDNEYHLKIRTADGQKKHTGFVRKYSEKFLSEIRIIEDERNPTFML